MSLILNLLTILVVVAIAYLVLYLFQKWVTPLDRKVVGIILFVLFAILLVYWLSGHSLRFW